METTGGDNKTNHFNLDAILSLKENIGFKEIMDVNKLTETGLQLHKEIEKYIENPITEKKGLKKINELMRKIQNLKVKNLQHENQSRIKSLIEKYGNYIEDNTKKVEKRLHNDKFLDVLHELIVAEHFSRKFSLDKKKEGNCDFSFSINQKTYLVECTTINTHQIDKKFLRFLPYFPQFCQIAMILKEEYKDLLTRGYVIQGNLWYYKMRQFITRIRPEAEDKIKIILDDPHFDKLKNDEKSLSRLFDDWIDGIIYTLSYFDFILPPSLYKELEKLEIEKRVYSPSRPREPVEPDGFILRRIAQTIIEKVQKSYFSEGKPVILCISLAHISDSIPIEYIDRFVKKICIELSGTINEIIEKKKNKESINANLKNLLAIAVESDRCFPANKAKTLVSNYNIFFYNTSCSFYNKEEELFDSLFKHIGMLTLC